MRVVLMGTGPFAVPAFEAIHNHGHHVERVLVRPLPPVKSRKGPPPQPVREWAESKQLPILSPDSINSDDSVRTLMQIQPDLLVVCDYGQILGDAALATATLGGINLHGSLLPRYRGAAPVQRALLAGDEITGISVIHMTPKLDGGPILASAQTPITESETSGELEDRLSHLGVEPTLTAMTMLDNWDRVSELGVRQDPEAVTKAPRLNKKEALINWNQTSKQIHCFIRGMQPWPIAFCFFPTASGKAPLRIAVKTARVVDPVATGNPESVEIADTQGDFSDAPSDPGTLLHRNRMLIKTGDGVLELLTIQPAGKREMTAEEFLRGYQPEIGTRLS